MLRHEISVLAQTVARAFDLDNDRMMKQSVKEGGGDDRIPKDLTPFSEATVGGEDHGALFVARVDKLEEQIAAAGNDRQVSDLVDDQQREATEEPDLLA